MPENILIAIAWPYANAEIHVGNITGSHLPGDIVARYHRLKGNKVLMVSGTDSHGTPVTIAADKEGKPVEEVYKLYHDGFHRPVQEDRHHLRSVHDHAQRESFQGFAEPSSLRCRKTDSCSSRFSQQWFSPASTTFLPDRYVEGTCYICGYRRRALRSMR